MSSYVFIAEGRSALERAFLEAGTALGLKTERCPNHVSIKTADVMICFPDELNRVDVVTICEVEGISCLALPEIEEESVPELTLELVKFISIYHPKEIVAFGGSETPGDCGKTTETQIMRLFVKAFSHTELLHVDNLNTPSLPSPSSHYNFQPSTSLGGTSSAGRSRRLWRRKSPRGAKVGSKSSNHSRAENTGSSTSTTNIDKLEASLKSFQGNAEADRAQRDELNSEDVDTIPGVKQSIVNCVKDDPTPYSTLPAPPPRRHPS